MSRNDRVRVGRFTFTPTSFWLVALLWGVFAGTAGAFRQQATLENDWLELLVSSQMVTLVLLFGLVAFIHEGIANWHPRLLPMARLVLISILGAHVGSVLVRLGAV